jgi:hypothetical protein
MARRAIEKPALRIWDYILYNVGIPIAGGILLAGIGGGYGNDAMG